MADNLTDTAENLMLDWLMGEQTVTRPTAPVKVRLMTANGTDSSAGTELGTSGGYTAGGLDAHVGDNASSGGTLSNAVAVSWTNMPAATIVGVELWDSAGSPVRLWYGALTASKTTASGDTFTIAIAALSVSIA